MKMQRYFFVVASLFALLLVQGCSSTDAMKPDTSKDTDVTKQSRKEKSGD